MMHKNGPGPRGGLSGLKGSGAAVKRLLRYVIQDYRWPFMGVLLCILVSAAAGVAGSLFLQVLIDGYITPLLVEANPNFSGLLRAVMVMGCIYLAGVAATYLYNRMMAVISQGVLKSIRDEMFDHMQSLPIRYFDTHTHGDVMSRYTNDTDTLRQMISQSVPQMFSAVITIVTVFAADAPGAGVGGLHAGDNRKNRRPERTLFRPPAGGAGQGERLY